MNNPSRDLESWIQLLVSVMDDAERMASVIGVRWDREEAPPHLRVMHGEAIGEIWGKIELRLPVDGGFAFCLVYPRDRAFGLPVLSDFWSYLGDRVAQVDVNIRIPPSGSTGLRFVSGGPRSRLRFGRVAAFCVWFQCGATFECGGRGDPVRHR